MVPVRSPFNQGVQAYVRGMRLREHQESPWVVALLQEESVYSVACFDVKSGTVLKYLECPFQGKWSTLSNGHLSFPVVDQSILICQLHANVLVPAYCVTIVRFYCAWVV